MYYYLIMCIWRKADALKQPIQSATEKIRPLIRNILMLNFIRHIK